MDNASTVIKILPSARREDKGQDESELMKPPANPDLKMASVQFLAGKICMNCHAHKTPLWRSGPYGSKTLCNACGVRHRYGRLAIYPLDTVLLKAYEAFTSPQWRQRSKESFAEEAAKQAKQKKVLASIKNGQPKNIETEKRIRKKKIPSDFFIDTHSNKRPRKKSPPVAIGIQMSEHDAASIILSLRNGIHHLPHQKTLSLFQVVQKVEQGRG